MVPDAIHHYGRMILRGDPEKAIDLFKREPLPFIRLTGLAIAYDKLGDRPTAQQYRDELIAEEGDNAAYQYAQIYAQWGETDKALDALELAWRIGDPGFIQIKSDRHMDPLRDQPRFISLMEKWWDPSKR